MRGHSGSWSTHDRKIDITVIGLGVVLGAIVTWRFLLDDGLITLRYSRNLLDGFGPNWNHTGPRVEGYTSFLFMLTVTLAGLVKINLIVAAKLLGSICLFGAALVAYRAVFRQTGARWASLAAALAIAWSPAMWLHAGSTLETTAYGLLLVSILAVIMTARQAELWVLTPLSLAIALMRPEGIAVAVLAHLVVFFFATTDRAALLKRFAAYVLLPFAAYIGWRWFYYGYPLPNTVYVKAGDTNLGSTARWFRANLLVWLPVAVASGYCLRRGYLSARVCAATAVPFLALIPYGLSLLVTDFFHRFMSLCYPALVVCMVVVIASLKTTRERGLLMLSMLALADYSAVGTTSVKNLAIVLVLLALIIMSILRAVANAKKSGEHARIKTPAAPIALMVLLVTLWHARGIEPHVVYAGRALNPVYGNFGRALAGAGPGLKVAVGDTGAIPYFSHSDVYDIAKLNDAATTHGANPRKVLDAFDPDVLMLYTIDGIDPIIGQKGYLDITNIQDRYSKRGFLRLWKTSFTTYGLLVYTKTGDERSTALALNALQHGRWSNSCELATWSCTLKKLVSSD